MTATEIVNQETGEIVEALDERAARSLLDGIKVNLEDAADLIEQLWSGRGWIALGFGSWDALVAAEIRNVLPKLERAERRAAVAKLAATGMSTRAIGAAVGVNQQTVSNDLKATAENSAVDLPAKVTGLDGRERTRTKPPAPEPTPPEQKAKTRELQRQARIHGAIESILAFLRQLNDDGVPVDTQVFLSLIQSAIEQSKGENK